jgi:broad specificity phosphatase PhoE
MQKRWLRYFVTRPLKVVVASTASRAIETAKIVTKGKGLEIRTTDLFLEREHPSELLGVSHSDEHFKKVKYKVEESFLKQEAYADEETFFELCERAGGFRKDLEELSENEVLVVGHGKFTKFFLAYLCYGEDMTPKLFLSLDKFQKSRNLGLSEIQFDTDSGEWTLRQWNSTFWQWL